MPDQKVLSLAEVAGLLGLSLHGDGQRQVRGIGALDSAQADQLSFLANAKYRRLLAETQAGAVIVHPDLLAEAQAAGDDRVILVSDNPYLAYAKASALFEPLEKPRAGVHPSAVVESDQVHPSASIGANCVIEAGAEIGEGTVIAPGTPAWATI